jgi:hypothetical protein
MATIPFSRNPQAARARHSKTLLLPLPRAEADKLSLQVHIALDTMRRGQGNANAAQTLCQVMIASAFLADAGYGCVTFEQMRLTEQVLSDAFDRGRDTGVWLLDGDAFAELAAIVTTYDEQLRRAPLAAIADAGEKLERFRAGETFDQINRTYA